MRLKKEALYFLAVIGYRKYNLTGKISSAYTVCQRVFKVMKIYKNVLKRYPSVFQNGIGSVKNIFKTDAKPKFMKP